MEVVVALIIVLGVITLLGHGIWVFLAWLFVDDESKPSATGNQPPAHCPRCGSQLVGRICSLCNWPHNYHRGDRKLVLGELRRQLVDFNELELIDKATAENLLNAITAELERQPTPSTTPAEIPLPSAELPELDVADVGSPIEPAQPTVHSPEDRVREFIARRAESTAEPESLAPPAPPQRAWTDLLAAFMEEKNIRWGELVGGLLIVCCSIALVISFWAKIAERPFLKFFVFNGVTAALFGLGLYSERRWKLRTTSDGLLIIAALLVPLNFLAIAAFTQGPNAAGLVTIVGELISIALFAMLLYSAGRIIIAVPAWLLAIGVLVPSIFMLLSRRFVWPDNGFVAAQLIGWAVLGVYGAINGLTLFKLFSEDNHATTRRAPTVFKMLGITAFATVLAFGLLVYRLGDLADAFHNLAPLVCAAGLIPLASGLTVWRKCNDPDDAPHRTAGLSIAVAGAMLLLLGVAFAWPEPRLLLITACIAAVTLSAVAILFRLPQAHLLATLCVVLGYLVTWHCIRGHLSWAANDARQSIAVLVSGESGQALLPLVAILVAIGGTLRRRNYADDARYLDFATAGVAALSLGLVTWFGFGVDGDPLHAALIYGLYAVAAYVVADRRNSLAALCASAGLLFAAVAQAVVFKYAAEHALALPWATALIIDAGLMAAVAGLLSAIGGTRRREQFVPALLVGTKCVSLIAVGLILVAIGLGASAAILFPRWLGLAAVLLAVAWVESSALWFSIFQTILAVTVWCGVAAWLGKQDWFRNAGRPWLDPWTLIAEGIALAILCTCGLLVRLVLRRSTEHKLSRSSQWLDRAHVLVNAPWPSIDTVLLRLLLVTCTMVAVYAALPGVMQELSPRLAVPGATATNRIVPPIEHFEIARIPHDHASGTGVWVWIAILAAALVVEMGLRKKSWNVLALVLLASLACPLLASAWQADVATASALRWLLAGFLLVTSAIVWSRERLAAAVSQWNLPRAAHDATPVIATLFALALLPLLAMVVYVGIGATLRHPPDVSTRFWFLPLGILFVVTAAIAVMLRAWFVNSRWLDDRRSARATLAGHTSTLLLILGVAPLIAVTLYVVAAALRQSPILGPNPTSWFARVGLATSYAVPILITAATLVGYAIRERSDRFALAGGLVLNLGVTAAYLLAIAKVGLRFDTTQWIRLAQLNAIVSAAFAVAWIGALWLWHRRKQETSLPISELLITQVCLPIALNLLILIPTWLAIFWNPWLSVELAPVGDRWGWSAVFLALLSVVAIKVVGKMPTIASELVVAAFALGTVLAAFVGNRTGAPWAAFHTLLVFHVGVVAALAAGSWLYEKGMEGPSLVWRRQISRCASWASIPVVALASWGLIYDPDAPWWSVAALLSTAVLSTWFAGWSLRRGLLHYAATLISLAALGYWAHEGQSFVGNSIPKMLFGFPQVFVISMALPVFVWLFVERMFLQPAGDFVSRTWLPPIQRLAVRLSLIVFSLLLALSLFADLMGEMNTLSITGQWLAVAAIVVGATALLWDAGARDAIALLYVTGLLICGTLVDSLDLNSHTMLWLGTITLAAYGLATSYLWSRRKSLRSLGDMLKIPSDATEGFAQLRWLIPVNCLLAAAVVTMTFAIELTYAEQSLRSLAANTVLASAVSIGLLARGERRTNLQFAALALGALWAIAVSWIPLDPASSGGLLNRSVAVAAALGVITAIYGIGLSKLLPAESEWLSAAQRIVPVLIVATGATLVFILGTEVTLFALHGEVAMAWQAIALVAVTLIGLSAASLVTAVLPGRDPLGLSERGRQVYVYAAEILLALGFVHIRLTMPWLFQGFWSRYWPIIVMLIAFIGAGVGEWFRRRRLAVLGDPLENTGAMLPLLPVLAFWVMPTPIDYSLLLLAVGLLYAGLSIARKSFGFGVLAALSANGGLWYFLNRLEGYHLLDHPQIWLIPPAVCVLIAAHINRKQLTESQMTAIRYACSVMVYVSSTADIFLNGVAQAPWLPVVLAGISLVGIFAGIFLRIRAFLFLGIAFLILALMTIIWHAAVDLDQTWLWYATGIVIGILIIAVFAVFEKKRDQVLHVIDQLKHWQS